MAKKKRKTIKKYPVQVPQFGVKWGSRTREEYAKQHFSQLARFDVVRGSVTELDLNSTVTKRRIKAITALGENIQKRFDYMYSDFPKGESLDADWIHINVVIGSPYDQIESDYAGTAVAAAIWIMDQIQKKSKYRELVNLLSEVPDFDDVATPYVWDSQHREKLLSRMIGLIFHRNDDQVKSNSKNQTNNGLHRCYITEVTAKGKINKEASLRCVYEKVLALIDDNIIREAEDLYTEKYWEWIDRYYTSRTIIGRRAVAIEREIDEQNRKIDEIEAKIYKTRFNMDSPSVTQNLVELRSVAPISSQMQSHTLNAEPFALVFDNSGLVQELLESKKIMDRRIALLKDLEIQRNDLIKCIGDFQVMGRSFIESRFGTEIADIWEGFEIEDPYQMCFAFLSLLDNGSDLPWCSFSGLNLMKACAVTLPWAYEWLEFTPRDACYNGDEPVSENAKPKQAIDNFSNLYELRFCNEDAFGDEWRFNLAQLLYIATGYVMPRNISETEARLKLIFDAWQVDCEKYSDPLRYFGAIIRNEKNLNDEEDEFGWDEEWADEESDTESDPLKGGESAEALKKQIEQMRAEIKGLKKSLHEATNEVKEQKKENEKLARKGANDDQELADLRSLVFHQQEGVYEEDEPVSTISFPYHTTKRIVVFGGHDSWAREIKPKLPDVRFISRTALPNADMIRRADVVWIQPNALAHSYFYTIINETRKYNIPVRYFSYASAVKCAEQIVEDD